MIKVFLSGLRMAASRPTVLIGVWLANVLVALPAAWVVATVFEDSFGSSLVAENMREGFDMSWYGEFGAEASGVAATFSPTQTGVGAFLINLEAWATGTLFDNFQGLLGLGVVWALVWALLLGGVLTRYAPASDTGGRSKFFEAGGRYFARFVRLALLAAPLYWLIYRLYRALQRWLAEWTRDTTRESTVLMYSLIAVLLVAFLLVLVRTCFDYAKIATVLEGRRSMLVAAMRGVGFVLVHPGRTMGLYMLVASASLVLLLLFAAIAPGSRASTAFMIWAGFAVSQAFLLARLYLRLSLLAGEMALYREFTVGFQQPAGATIVDAGAAPAPAAAP